MATNDYPDPPIDEIRAVRHAISARFGHDIKRLVEHYMELQKRHGDRLIWAPGAHKLVGGHASTSDDVA